MNREPKFRISPIKKSQSSSNLRDTPSLPLLTSPNPTLTSLSADLVYMALREGSMVKTEMREAFYREWDQGFPGAGIMEADDRQVATVFTV